MSDLDDLQRRLETIEERNRRVEADKAWETSFVRTILIASLIFVVASLFLFLTNPPQPLINAFVPAVGWILSIQSLPFIKQWWFRKNRR